MEPWRAEIWPNVNPALGASDNQPEETACVFHLPPKEKGFEVNFGGFQGEYVRALRCSRAHEFCCTHVVLT
jgi:hypothetical protein